MLRKGYIAVIALLVLVFSAVPAFAGLHFVGGAGVGTGSLIAQVSVAGFGNDAGEVSVTINVSGTDLTAWCQNKGGSVAPGQNTVSIDVNAAPQTFIADKNGTATANFYVNLVEGMTATDVGCPNKQWSIVDLTGYLRVHFTAVNITTGEQAELKLDCLYNEPFGQVECVPASGW